MRKETKRCGKCRKVKAIDDFWKLKSSPDGRAPWCTRCVKNYRARRSRVPEKLWRQRLHEEAIKHYGGKCDCCRERMPEFLTLVGKRPRSARSQLAWWVKKRGYPPGFSVRCHNCKEAIERYGCCPHQPAI